MGDKERMKQSEVHDSPFLSLFTEFQGCVLFLCPLSFVSVSYFSHHLRLNTERAVGKRKNN